MFRVGGFGQDIQHVLLQLLDETGRVVPAQFDAAHLDLPALKYTEITVGHRDACIHPGWQKCHPAIHSVQTDRQSGAGQDLIQQGQEIGYGDRTGLFDPHPIHVEMQDLKTQILGSFLGAQQDLASIGGHGLVRFDPPKTGVLVAQVPEAGHQQPLVGRYGGLIAFAARVPFGQGQQLGFDSDALFQKWLERFGNQTALHPGDWQAGAGVIFPEHDRLRGDVEVRHDAGVHGDEINFGHVTVQADGWLVDHAAHIGVHEFEQVFGSLSLLLVPGNQNALAQGRHDLHGRDARPR